MQMMIFSVKKWVQFLKQFLFSFILVKNDIFGQSAVSQRFWA